jgi:hypothetical protein
MARNNTPASNSLRIGSSYRFFAASSSDAASVHEGDHDLGDERPITSAVVAGELGSVSAAAFAS